MILLTYRLEGAGENHCVVNDASDAIRLIAQVWNEAFALAIGNLFMRAVLVKHVREPHPDKLPIVIQVPPELAQDEKAYLELRVLPVGEWFGSMVGTVGKDF